MRFLSLTAVTDFPLWLLRHVQHLHCIAVLFSQDPDYITVKERVANFCADGVEADGVATIDIAVETLRVAEYLTPTMREQLK